MAGTASWAIKCPIRIRCTVFALRDQVGVCADPLARAVRVARGAGPPPPMPSPSSRRESMAAIGAVAELARRGAS